MDPKSRCSTAYGAFTGDGDAVEGDLGGRDCRWRRQWSKRKIATADLPVSVSVSTGILGRRTAPFAPFLIPHRAPHGFNPINPRS